MSDLSGLHRMKQNDDLMSPATQVVGNRADYLGEGQGEIGQRVSDDKLELFVTVDPALALLQQFAQATPEFIVLHDVGGIHSLRLLNAVAGALRTKVQQLAIRRQGHGVALAVLPFVEMPGRGSQHLRVYSTDIDTDSNSRRQLANVLLGHSRLAVMMVAEMPAHALGKALQPMRDAIAKGPWPNRELLLVPLGSASALAAEAGTLLGPRGLNIQVTPQPPAPNAAWGFVSGAWNRLRQSTPPPAASAQPARPDAPTEPMPLPVPEAAARASAPPTAGLGFRLREAPAQTSAPPQDAVRSQPTSPAPVAMPSDTPHGAALQPGRWDGYLATCQGIKGLVSACVFDFRTARALAYRGARPEADRLVAQGVHLFSVLAESSRALGLGPAQPDAAVTLTGHHLLLHPLPGHPGIILHAVLDASIANLTLARMQLQRVDTTELGTAGRG